MCKKCAEAQNAPMLSREVHRLFLDDGQDICGYSLNFENIRKIAKERGELIELNVCSQREVPLFYTNRSRFIPGLVSAKPWFAESSG